MSIVGDIREALAVPIRTTSVRNAYPRPVTQIVPPAAIITRGAWNAFEDLDASKSYRFGVIVACQLGTWDSGTKSLDDCVEEVVAALTADQSPVEPIRAVHIPEVSGESIRAIGGTDYATCEITVEVLT